MEILEKMARSAIVPVVVLDGAKDAVPTAKAMLAGGIDVMEITFRTAAAADSIRAVSEECPEMLVGAGTVVNLEQCKLAVECGAKFIVSPGYDEETVAWCVENGIAVTPGCITPTEIMMALKHDLKVLKFFPANIYGGLSALKALSGPFPGLKFIPTGGVNIDNVAEFISAPYVHAVGGSWVCPKNEISSGNFEKITELCRRTRAKVLDYEVMHMGINVPDAGTSSKVAEEFCKAFGFEVKPGNGSNFAGPSIEVMKKLYYGTNGHIAIGTNKIEAAVADLESKGYTFAEETRGYKNGSLVMVYLKDEIGGFAVHLLQK